MYLFLKFQEYFKDIENWKTFFYQVKKVGKYEGEFLPPPQLENLANRLTAMMREIPRREKRLDFQEYQHRLLAIREAAEARLAEWMVKLGHQEEVEDMMVDYQVRFCGLPKFFCVNVIISTILC